MLTTTPDWAISPQTEHAAALQSHPPQHPLDPLTADEIRHAVDLVKQGIPLDETWRFAIIQLHEPPKQTVLDFQSGDPIERQVFVVLYHRLSRTTYEGILSLTSDKIVDWRAVPDVQPVLMTDEILECDQLIRKDRQFISALLNRGITNLDRVMIDYWTVGYFGIPEEAGHRLVRGHCFLRTDAHENGYARPIEGLIPVIDLDEMSVFAIEDLFATAENTRGIPLPAQPGNFAHEFLPEPRRDLKPLLITQPDGPSFEVNGHEVRWQNWRFRISFNIREGLVLHTVGYEEQGQLRPILYRASLAEMVVPYGDPRAPHFRKNAFDVGEYALGGESTSLVLGCDCLGEIHYFDAILFNNNGDPYELPHAVCMHEEDFGVLWKHTDWRTERSDMRRSRRLVISFFATVGNYDYGFFWYFYQDGSIHFEVKLTGILNVSAAYPGQPYAYGTYVAPQLISPIHQHFFAMRLDMQVDGLGNSVYEVHSETEPMGAHNPYGNAFRSHATLLKTESEAQQQVDPLAGRYWKVTNPSVLNPLGDAVAYALVPGENVRPLSHPDSPFMQRAGFLAQHLWVTPFDPQEKYPAGDYPNQSPGGDGLPLWTQANRPIDNTDVVLWYTFGCTHLPRPEEWPIMPVAYVGFQLKPLGFFGQNPTLDLPTSLPQQTCCDT